MPPLKSRVENYLQVLAHIFVDVARLFPDLVDSLSHDLESMVVSVRARGESCLTVDLPAAGKHFDRCLAEGQYTTSGLSFTASAHGCEPIPKFLGGLFGLIFDGNGLLKESADVGAISACRQVYLGFKKVKLPCPPELVADEVRKFFEEDSALPLPSPYWQQVGASIPDQESVTQGFLWDHDIMERACTTYSHEEVGELTLLLSYLDKVSGYIAHSLGHYDPMEWSFRHGPGSVANLPENGFKYSFENWNDRLDAVYSYDQCAFHSIWAWAGSNRDVGNLEIPSKLIAVPKDLTKPRLIASEPVEMMWCQQNLRHFIYSKVQEHPILSGFIKFRDQSLNQRLAAEGSKTGRLATVDLSSASDRVTCAVVECMFRRNLGVLSALRATRTLSTRVGKTDPVVLRKFATMGNACTFPVQTLVFLSIALASVLYARRLKFTEEALKSLLGEVTVFGDDIIVPVECRKSFLLLLDLLWFKVNPNKTFWTGLFRESCGLDVYAGVPVTPAYYAGDEMTKPEDVVSMVEVSNNFYKKGLLSTAEMLAQTVPWGFPMVDMSSGAVGFKCRTAINNEGLPRRWNNGLQRHEVRILALNQRQKRTSVNSDDALLQFFTELPEPFLEWASGVLHRPRLKLAWKWVDVIELGS